MKLQAAIKYAEDDMKACIVNMFYLKNMWEAKN